MAEPTESSVVAPPDGVRPGSPALSWAPGDYDNGWPFLLTRGHQHHRLTRPEVEHLVATGWAALTADAGALECCVGDRHHVSDAVARLTTGVLHRCRHCPAEFVLEDDGTTVPVAETPRAAVVPQPKVLLEGRLVGFDSGVEDGGMLLTIHGEWVHTDKRVSLGRKSGTRVVVTEVQA